uniref:Uncharacterized protein n=1 Tax=Hyaloperonospora arabidopsidis (strain Emoy2) TaxID=559515 RepID=M4BAJ0_HYAAE
MPCLIVVSNLATVDSMQTSRHFDKSVLNSDNDWSESSLHRAHLVTEAADTEDRDLVGDNSEDSSDSDSDDVPVSGSSTASAASTTMLESMKAAFKLGSVLNATSTITPTYTNWVGNALNSSTSSGCWRRAHIAKTCPHGYESKLGTCWMRCPYSYPVECGLECLRQNDQCALALFSKVAAVVQTTMGLSSWSVYGNMAKWSKGFKHAFRCTKYMISLTKSLVKFIRYWRVSAPQTTSEEILQVMYQIDNVIIDIPVTIAYCRGGKVSDGVKFADSLLTTVEYLLREVLYYGTELISNWDTFASLMKNITLGDSIASLNKTDISSLKSALKSSSTCGYDMKRLLDRTWMTVAELRRLNPEISKDGIRVIMSESNLVLNDIPIATNNCMVELLAKSDDATAYAIRDTLRRTFGVIVEDLTESGTSRNGTYLTATEYAVFIADRAIAFWSIWDPFYLSSIISEYFEPLCSPTEFIGEIDDGDVTMALGMSIVQDVFMNSDGMWTKVGDGSITITFNSVDTEDVTVNIKSGGDKIDEVDVPAGETVTWQSNVTALGGKTLYLNRWRSGFLGIPGTAGGSLLLWIPRSTQGGSLRLTAMLNKS